MLTILLALLNLSNAKNVCDSKTENCGTPVLLEGTNLVASSLELGIFKGNEHVVLSNNDKTVEWKDPHEFAWIPIPTHLQLHSGNFFIEFSVEVMAKAQIGAGFLLDWNIGPDWGFFGYLGSSPTAWSYDPSTGDIVTNTESVAGGLPTFKGDKGTIGIRFWLPPGEKGKAQFVVDGIDLEQFIELPASAVVVPAVCFLKKAQKVTITALFQF
eukprot:TRINITY_DN23712_c0_g1_i1.p1 TRINITY_DN23712_c0_g1~~TRINITY_DN23712_c0_g1_i1.p1  ORF type:complete len:213 (-),score=64.70 TRINITY_DN23712_c0_g1_i1:60-698(-)